MHGIDLHEVDTAVLRRYGVEEIWTYGIAFCGKKCREDGAFALLPDELCLDEAVVLVISPEE